MTSFKSIKFLRPKTPQPFELQALIVTHLKAEVSLLGGMFKGIIPKRETGSLWQAL